MSISEKGISSKAVQGSFYIDKTHVNSELGLIERDGCVYHIEPRLMKLLVYLAKNSHTTVSKEMILNDVWGQVDVSDESLSQAISKARHYLGDSARRSHIIKTIPKVGYRLIASVMWAKPTIPATLPPMPLAKDRKLVLVAALCALLAFGLVFALASTPYEEIEIEIDYNY